PHRLGENEPMRLPDGHTAGSQRRGGGDQVLAVVEIGPHRASLLTLASRAGVRAGTAQLAPAGSDCPHQDDQPPASTRTSKPSAASSTAARSARGPRWQYTPTGVDLGSSARPTWVSTRASGMCTDPGI